MPGANKVAVVEGFVVVGEQAERLQGSALGQQYPLYQRGLRWPMIEYQYGDRDPCVRLTSAKPASSRVLVDSATAAAT